MGPLYGISWGYSKIGPRHIATIIRLIDGVILANFHENIHMTITVAAFSGSLRKE